MISRINPEEMHTGVRAQGLADSRTGRRKLAEHLLGAGNQPSIAKGMPMWQSKQPAGSKRDAADESCMPQGAMAARSTSRCGACVNDMDTIQKIFRTSKCRAMCSVGLGAGRQQPGVFA